MKTTILGALCLFFFLSAMECKNDPVPVPVKTVTIKPPASIPAVLTPGSTLQFSFDIQPPDAANKKVSWKSSDETRAKVDATGKVTIPATATAGTVIITVTTNEGAKTATWSLTVSPPPTSSPVITITTHPENTSLVQNITSISRLSVAASVTLGATLSYQWYSNTTNSNTGGTPISGVTSAYYDVASTLSSLHSPYYYFCEVRATGGATPVRSKVATVTVSATAFEGTGTESNPYLIKSAADLELLGQLVNADHPHYGAADKFYKQTANINLASFPYWIPIGHGSHFFQGKYNGNNMEISNMTVIPFGTENGSGLFGFVGGEVLYVRLKNVTVSGNAQVGGVAGAVGGDGAIIACSVSVTSITGKQDVGGIVGGCGGIVKNCMVTPETGTALISGTGGNVGGIAGYGHYGTVANCYTTCNVKGKSAVGGVVGNNNYNGRVLCCYATGVVTAVDGSVGGIVGSSTIDDDVDWSVEDCVALNSKVERLNGNEDIGRVVGKCGYFLSGYHIVKQLNNNFSRPDMTLTESGKNVSLKNMSLKSDKEYIHGQDVEAINYNGANSGTWWGLHPASGGPWFLTSSWILANNALPKLIGF